MGLRRRGLGCRGGDSACASRAGRGCVGQGFSFLASWRARDLFYLKRFSETFNRFMQEKADYDVIDPSLASAIIDEDSSVVARLDK
jgi:hypothetical protein